MARDNKDLGQRGEIIIRKFLEENDFLILDKNIYFWGGEIDLVAIKNDCIHFIEVKTRKDTKDLHITEVLSKQQLKTLLRSVRLYLYKRNFDEMNAQIDLFLVRFFPDQTFKIESLENITFFSHDY